MDPSQSVMDPSQSVAGLSKVSRIRPECSIFLKFPFSMFFYLYVFVLFPQHLVEGLLNFRRRVCRSFWLDLASQDPPPENGPITMILFFLSTQRN